jgi:hypothetical protein
MELTLSGIYALHYSLKKTAASHSSLRLGPTATVLVGELAAAPRRFTLIIDTVLIQRRDGCYRVTSYTEF